MKINLTTGLLRTIEAVKQLPENTVFGMGEYNTCVIGKTLGWTKDECGEEKEASTLRRIFGIRKVDDEYTRLFSEWSEDNYSTRTWKVIKLFTTAIAPDDGDITRDDWLKEARKVLSELV
ncbi:hypothetical protein HYQ21_gp008 [Acinetobacter phage vB_AbaM_Apostate]|uniref:Uncharacterized protein n=1 Tax=Acinetobacter phage vB_AbaM_Apostate TaxID=2686308 RepID=A0A6B9J4V9_9CAUD|nr:hypothetical protein HYQ21_gp008 [Acinetobacter phage vB_AbaM_Apostate]QGZ15599.1 hypothetical protein Apostate_008 [Acinetobacter phage vB_AbaM_Apostate]